VQDPESAERRAMPDAAIAGTVADAVLPLEEIPGFLHGLCCGPVRSTAREAGR
jgi:chemotaxis response regulator CheB